MLLLITNLAESAPPTIENWSVAGTSGSSADTVVTVVEFSAMEVTAVGPPPLLVITGVSFALPTVITIACVSTSKPSEACTVTSYPLLLPTSFGASKFGAEMKAIAPVLALIVKRAASGGGINREAPLGVVEERVDQRVT